MPQVAILRAEGSSGHAATGVRLNSPLRASGAAGAELLHIALATGQQCCGRASLRLAVGSVSSGESLSTAKALSQVVTEATKCRYIVGSAHHRDCLSCAEEGPLLAGLLSGLREVRAPLAAGYLWLVAAWVVLEPVVPVRAEASGVVESLYRASDVLSVLGLGIALSFAAYILGSISSSTLTPLLRRFSPCMVGLIETSGYCATLSSIRTSKSRPKPDRPNHAKAADVRACALRYGR
jgi:hypothetical protein